jgi:hypothetical protein
MAARCSSTPARLACRARSPRCATTITGPAGATTGSRKRALNARPCPSQAQGAAGGPVMDIYDGAEKPMGQSRPTLPRNNGVDADGLAQTEADHHMKCPGCDQWFDMRDLGPVLDHVHGAEIEIIGNDERRRCEADYLARCRRPSRQDHPKIRSEPRTAARYRRAGSG